ncbi:MAG: class I SAM-dependent methyltransferase [Lachnospiraceae bacterium]|nr:class I SAM-dependent methyltransferase [Lachnospiraceae bacterium]
MASIYDRAAIYDLIDSEDRYKICQNHWKAVFDNRPIQTCLDVSIGSGSVTLPLSDLQVKLSGSDLSETMLESCRKKAAAKNIDIELQCCDFRTVASRFSHKFDCVASTGNSLPYVTNEDVCKALEQMDALINPGGYLYFDIRNWDKILRERNRFYLYNPFFDGDTRINLIQVWDYHEDDTMTFNLLYTFEKDNRIFQKEKFEEHYIPVKKQILLNKLEQMGYGDIEVMNFPIQQPYRDIDDVDWYCVIAKKSRRA